MRAALYNIVERAFAFIQYQSVPSNICYVGGLYQSLKLLLS